MNGLATHSVDAQAEKHTMKEELFLDNDFRSLHITMRMSNRLGSASQIDRLSCWGCTGEGLDIAIFLRCSSDGLATFGDA